MEYVSADVKDMMSTADAPSIEVSFTGSYTADGDTVTLAAPTGITANVTPVAASLTPTHGLAVPIWM